MLLRVVFLRLTGPAELSCSGWGGGIALRSRGESTVGEVGRGEGSLGRRLSGSSPLSKLSRICSVCTDKSRSVSAT